jgi:signal transduction histidine kinase
VRRILLQAALIARLLNEQRLCRHAEAQARQRMSELAHVNRFSTAGELGERKMLISTTRLDNLAEVAISDAGHGIPSDKIKEVFEPFYSTKTNGMGMGLSIARTIVEAHDGQIWAENLPSGGAFVRLKLPLVLHRL